VVVTCEFYIIVISPDFIFGTRVAPGAAPAKNISQAGG
jgi:hypothetical protein